MYKYLPLLLCGALLGGCAGGPRDITGTWINQAAIDAAAEHGHLREALQAYGPVLEWRFAPQRYTAWSSDGVNISEGHLAGTGEQAWKVSFHGNWREQLTLDAGELHQHPSASAPMQHFQPVESDEQRPGRAFEQALYAALLGGSWTIREGEGRDERVRFHPDGRIEGLPGAEHYALCLAGDCAARSSELELLWLQQAKQGREWLFRLDHDALNIFVADNQAAADARPQYQPGQRAWLLERD